MQEEPHGVWGVGCFEWRWPDSLRLCRIGGQDNQMGGIFSRGTSQVLCLDTCVFFCASWEVGPTRFLRSEKRNRQKPEAPNLRGCARDLENPSV